MRLGMPTLHDSGNCFEFYVCRLLGPFASFPVTPDCHEPMSSELAVYWFAATVWLTSSRCETPVI